MMSSTAGRIFAGILCFALTAFAGGADTCSVGLVSGLKETTKGQPNRVATKEVDFSDANQKGKLLPAEAFDGNLRSKYYNPTHPAGKTPGIDSGFVVTLSAGPQVVKGIQFATAELFPGRDPIKITVEGSNDSKALENGCNDFTLLYEGPSGLENTTEHPQWGQEITFPNTTAYKSYRVLVTAMRDETGKDSYVRATNYSEVRFLTAETPAAGNPKPTATSTPTPTPTPVPTPVVEKKEPVPTPSTSPTRVVSAEVKKSPGETYLSLQQAAQVKMPWGKAGNNLSVNGKPLCIGKQIFDKGIGLTASSEVTFKLDEKARWVTFYAGIDSELMDTGALRIDVYADDQVVYESSTMRCCEDPIYVSREIKKKDAKELRLVVQITKDGTGSDLLDVCNLRISSLDTEPLRDAAASIKKED